MQKLLKALLETQKELTHIAHDDKGRYGEYATCEKMIADSRAALHKHGLMLFCAQTDIALSKSTLDPATGELTPAVEIIKRRFNLFHESGEMQVFEHAYPITVNVTGKGFRDLSKDTAAADTFGLLYFLRNLLFVPRGEKFSPDHSDEGDVCTGADCVTPERGTRFFGTLGRLCRPCLEEKVTPGSAIGDQLLANNNAELKSFNKELMRRLQGALEQHKVLHAKLQELGEGRVHEDQAVSDSMRGEPPVDAPKTVVTDTKVTMAQQIEKVYEEKTTPAPPITKDVIIIDTKGARTDVPRDKWDDAIKKQQDECEAKNAEEDKAELAEENVHAIDRDLFDLRGTEPNAVGHASVRLGKKLPKRVTECLAQGAGPDTDVTGDPKDGIFMTPPDYGAEQLTDFGWPETGRPSAENICKIAADSAVDVSILKDVSGTVKQFFRGSKIKATWLEVGGVLVNKKVTEITGYKARLFMALIASRAKPIPVGAA